MENYDRQKTVPINSLWEAAYLLYKDMTFITTETYHGKVIFIFPNTPEVENILREFTDNHEVKIQQYISTFQRLKSLVYQIKGSENGQKAWLDKGTQRNM